MEASVTVQATTSPGRNVLTHPQRKGHPATPRDQDINNLIVHRSDHLLRVHEAA